MALYQQGNQKIEIIVKAQSAISAAGPKGNKVVNTDTPVQATSRTWQDAVFGTSNPKRIHRIIKTNATHTLAVSKQIVDLGIEYYIGGIGYMNGDQSVQSQVSRQMEIFKDGTNLASSVAMGALYGSWGGPIGAVLGATMAFASTGTSLAVKYANRERDYGIKVFKQENAIEYKRARAKINLTNGRLR